MLFLWKAVFRALSHSLPLPAPLVHFLAFLSSVDQSSDAALSSFSLPVALGSFCICSAHCYPAYGHTGHLFRPLYLLHARTWGILKHCLFIFTRAALDSLRSTIFAYFSVRFMLLCLRGRSLCGRQWPRTVSSLKVCLVIATARVTCPKFLSHFLPCSCPWRVRLSPKRQVSNLWEATFSGRLAPLEPWLSESFIFFP